MSLFRAASSISALTLVSRVLGLARDALAAWAFGAGPVAGAFHIAWLLPNLFRRLLGEGALSAAFLPAYARRLEAGDEHGARRLLAGVSGMLVAVLGGLAVLVSVAAFVVPRLLPATAASGHGTLLTDLTAILFPYVVPICWLGVLTGAANVHRMFAIPAAAPILLNVFWITGLVGAAGLGLTAFVELAPDAEAALDLPDGARFVAWFLLVGGFAQLAVCGLWPLARRGALARPVVPTVSGRLEPGVGRVLAAMLPTALGLGISQINALLDQVFAYWLVGAGSNAYLYLANRLLLFPHALVALPLGVAVFPELARLASGPAHDRADRLAKLRARLATAARASWLLAVPAALGLALVADDLVRLLFEHGRFGSDDTPRAVGATIALVAGLPAVSMIALLARTLYAFDAHTSVARAAAWLAPANLVLNLAFLGLGLREAGLALATSLCSWVQFVWLHGMVERRLAEAAPRPAGARAAMLRIFGSCVVMAAAVLTVRALLPAATADRQHVALLRLALSITAGGAAYLGTQAALGGPELRRLVDRLRQRLGR